MSPTELGCGQDLWQLWLSLDQQGLHQSSEKLCHQGVGSCGSCPLHRMWCQSLMLSTVTCTSLTASDPAATKNTAEEHVGLLYGCFPSCRLSMTQPHLFLELGGLWASVGSLLTPALTTSSDTDSRDTMRPQSSQTQSPIGHSQQQMWGWPLDVGMWTGATKVPPAANPRDQP